MTAIGIGLGTTHSVVAVLHGGEAEVLLNAGGEALTPSVVALVEGRLEVGRSARELLGAGSPDAVGSFKRHLGEARRFALGSESFDATELSALVLG